MTQESGQETEEAGEQTWPGGDVGGEEVVDAETTLCGQEQVQDEEEGGDGEGDDWLVPGQPRHHTHHTRADHLHQAYDAGHRGQEDQDEQQPRPQPAYDWSIRN